MGRWLNIVGGPAPYREAIEQGLSGESPASGDQTIEHLARNLDARVAVVFCNTDANRAHLTELVADRQVYGVAILPDLEVALYRWAIDIGARGVMYEDNTISYLREVVRSALHHDVLLPSEVLRSLLPDDQASAPELELSTTETAVLTSLAEGLAVTDIANSLYLNKRTVQRRITDLCLRLGASSASHAVHIAHRAGLLT